MNDTIHSVSRITLNTCLLRCIVQIAESLREYMFSFLAAWKLWLKKCNVNIEYLE